MEINVGWDLVLILICIKSCTAGTEIDGSLFLARSGTDVVAINVDVSTVWTRSRIACTLACEEKTGCKSYNFYRYRNAGRYQCDLIDGIPEFPDFNTNSGGTYYEKKLNCETISPCQNGGTCVSDSPFSYHCLCPYLCSGSHCENCCAMHGVTGEVTTVTVSTGGIPTDINVKLENGPDGQSIILMRRMDGSVDFDRGWADYQNGFGNLAGEFWLGNDNIYLLTNNGSYRMRIDMMSFNGVCRWAEYSVFVVAGSNSNYRLSIGGHSGDIGDGLYLMGGGHNINGQRFSAKNRDNDLSWENCAATRIGGWWYNSCSSAKLTSVYALADINPSLYQGNYWPGLGSLKYMDMKIQIL